MSDFSKRMLAMAAAAFLAVGMNACGGDDDDDNNNGTPSQPSQQTQKCTSNTCLGDVLYQCNTLTGEVTPVYCDQQGMVCSVTGCRVECTASSCLNPMMANVCNASHKYVPTKCAAGQTCANGGCTNDPCAACTAEQICEDRGDGIKCHSDMAAQTVPVGKQCSCEGGDCTFTISGAELKNAMGAMASLLPSLGINIVETDVITAPNFFSTTGNKGCEDLAASAPAGMTVGCLRDASITFPQSVVDIVLNDAGKLVAQFGGLIGSINSTTTDLSASIQRVGELLASGINFKSRNGYCLYATIDISGQTNIPMLPNVLAKDGLLSKINTGNHAQAKDAQCPVGSTKFSYSFAKDLEGMLSVDIGFDMCLKSCIQDSDCRSTEGYKCIEIPDGVPGEGQSYDDPDYPKKKACFDSETIEYFTNMTHMLDDLKPKA